jgi:hypothetical protein
MRDKIFFHWLLYLCYPSISVAKKENTVIVNSQYRLNPTTEQKLILSEWLRICRYWYNRQLGERFHWWDYNRSNALYPQGEFCQISCSVALGELKDKPDYYHQKKQLPLLKQDLRSVDWSGELLDFTYFGLPRSLRLYRKAVSVDKSQIGSITRKCQANISPVSCKECRRR